MMRSRAVREEVASEIDAPRRYDAILFDMGYTLIYFEPTQEEIVHRALRDAGTERSVEEIQAAVRVVWGKYYADASTAVFPATEAYDRQAQATLSEHLLGQLGLDRDPVTLEAYADSLETWFRRPGVIRPYPDVHHVLRTLRDEGYRLGMVSNWSWNLRQRVAQVGLEQHFEVIWASAYAGCNKPHPGIFRQALARMQPPQPTPARALYVGDSYEHDVVGARNAGMDAVLLEREPGATAVDCPVITTLHELLERL
jgi:putative hydrolase of the HAD superfamily